MNYSEIILWVVLICFGFWSVFKEERKIFQGLDHNPEYIVERKSQGYYLWYKEYNPIGPVTYKPLGGFHYTYELVLDEIADCEGG
tara:strand:- start:565 stop:819 length:255 start_codon:yes stop_codon:yes gene_type:complete